MIAQAVDGRIPHYTLLNKDLLRLGKAHDQAAPALRSLNIEFIAPRLLDALILDLDSTVETTKMKACVEGHCILKIGQEQQREEVFLYFRHFRLQTEIISAVSISIAFRS